VVGPQIFEGFLFLFLFFFVSDIVFDDMKRPRGQAPAPGILGLELRLAMLNNKLTAHKRSIA